MKRCAYYITEYVEILSTFISNYFMIYYMTNLNCTFVQGRIPPAYQFWFAQWYSSTYGRM